MRVDSVGVSALSASQSFYAGKNTIRYDQPVCALLTSREPDTITAKKRDLSELFLLRWQMPLGTRSGK